MDVHPTKNGINRYWSIPIWFHLQVPIVSGGCFFGGEGWCSTTNRWSQAKFSVCLPGASVPSGSASTRVVSACIQQAAELLTAVDQLPTDHGETRIWVNYNISLTWIKAILGWFPLLTMIIVRENSEVVIIYPEGWSSNYPLQTLEVSSSPKSPTSSASGLNMVEPLIQWQFLDVTVHWSCETCKPRVPRKNQAIWP